MLTYFTITFFFISSIISFGWSIVCCLLRLFNLIHMGGNIYLLRDQLEMMSYIAPFRFNKSFSLDKKNKWTEKTPIILYVSNWYDLPEDCMWTFSLN